MAYANETVDGYHVYLAESLDVRGISLPVVNNTGETNDDGVPLGNNVTADKSIREALNYGINRTDIAKGALNGVGVPNYDGISHFMPMVAMISPVSSRYATKKLFLFGLT